VKRAIITGASSGIGAALARELVRRGWFVVLLARRAELLLELAADLAPNAAAVVCDVTDRIAVRRAVDAHGPFDLAIANAGISVPTYAASFQSADGEAVVRVNVFGMFYLFEAVIPSMIERRIGRFAGVASIAGLRGLPSSSVYSASKAAMQAFLEASRAELSASSVGVTTINPGYVDTPIIEKYQGRLPFVVPVERAARIIVDGLEAGKSEIEFPLPMSLLMRTVRLLPNALYDRIGRIFAKRRIDMDKVLR
jgi:short-subunit dehydrogenase